MRRARRPRMLGATTKAMPVSIVLGAKRRVMKQSDDADEGPIRPAPCAGLRSGSRPAGARRAGGPVCHLLCERTCLARQQTWPYLWPRVLSLPTMPLETAHCGIAVPALVGPCKPASSAFAAPWSATCLSSATYTSRDVPIGANPQLVHLLHVAPP